MSVYSDRHMIFRSPKDKQTIEQELAGEPVPLSQFGQALAELGITHIKAFTPQAKGRVERLFQTLQDPLCIPELRLRGIDTIEAANKVLPELIQAHNEKFAVEPRDSEKCVSSPWVKASPWISFFAIVIGAHGAREKTISFEGKTYQIDAPGNKQTIPLKTRVEVRKTLDNKLYVRYKGEDYPLKETVKPKRQPQKKKASSERKPHKPAPNHPWRQYGRTSRIRQRA